MKIKYRDAKRYLRRDSSVLIKLYNITISIEWPVRHGGGLGGTGDDDDGDDKGDGKDGQDNFDDVDDLEDEDTQEHMSLDKPEGKSQRDKNGDVSSR
jgi:hypothetical protein